MRRLLLLSVPLLLAALPARADTPRDLDAALKDQAGKILDYARKHNAKNIGVLKFLVRAGDGPFSDNAGPLNNGLADRLTVALVLALPDEEIGVVANANEVLAGSKANHLDDDGRAACFRSRARGFILAWGDPEIPVKPDLFITGTATISKDLKQTTVKLQAFGKDCKLDDLPGEIVVPTSTRTLIDTGHSYLLTPKANPDMFKGARGRPKEDLDNVASDASTKYNADLSNQPLPSFESEAPIRVTILYNDVPAEVKNGAVREPKEGETVSFKLENLSDEIHGVVLKVNGENTIMKERFDDRDCAKWLLAPKGKQKEHMRDTIIIRGFQTQETTREDFKVLSPEASKANEVRYGPFAGTFHVSVFRAKGDKAPEPEPPAPPVVKEDPQQVVAAISRGTLRVGKIQPGDLKSLQAELRQRERQAENGRGAVDSDPDNPKPHLVVKVPFTPDPPIPVMSYRIRYYQPGNGK